MKRASRENTANTANTADTANTANTERANTADMKDPAGTADTGRMENTERALKRFRTAGERRAGRRARRLCLLAAACVLCLAGCSGKQEYAETGADIADSFPLKAEPAGENPQLVQSDGPYAVVHTTAGDITILLYEEQAPKAVENFIRLAEEGYYDGSRIFYVKKDELAQMGKPKAAEKETAENGEEIVYGEEKSVWGEPFEDEFDDGLHNFPGAVGMAGDGMDNNLSQFYFTVSEEKPEDERVAAASMYVNELIREAQETLNGLASPSDAQVQEIEDKLNADIQAVNETWIPEPFMARYQPAVEQYKKYGGMWGLDYKQTVFGQIVEGMNVAEAITEVKVNASDRSPQKELIIESVEILDSLKAPGEESGEKPKEEGKTAKEKAKSGNPAQESGTDKKSGEEGEE